LHSLTGVSIHQDHFQGDTVAEAMLLPGITLWYMSIIENPYKLHSVGVYDSDMHHVV